MRSGLGLSTLDAMRRLLAIAATLLVGCGGCSGADGGGPGGGDGVSSASGGERPDSCPARAEAPSPLPGVEARHRTLAYWKERAETYGPLDEVLLDPDGVRNHERALALPVEDRPLGHADLLAEVDVPLLRTEVTERLAFLHERVSSGAYLRADGTRLPAEVADAFRPPERLPALSPELRTARGLVRFRCGPLADSVYTESLDLRFDRNNCSTAHPGEVVQLLARWEGGMWLARTGYTLGFVAEDSDLSPVTPEQARARVESEPRPITRRAVLEAAFELLDSPYGWGGEGGGRDCSRFLMDVLGGFGLDLPRHSGRQALAGTFSIDVAEVESEREKLLLVDSAARKGIVLLHFPGHIMLYLGRTEEGTPMAIHAFAEYLEPCEGVTLDDGTRGETLRMVDRVTVSDLSLGRGTSRTSFLERITRVTVLGKAPGVELRGAASLRSAAPVVVPEEECRDTLDLAVFRSPSVPNAQEPLRVIVTASEDPGPVELVLVAPDGSRVTPEVRTLGGPPYTWWTRIDSPAPGRWTAVLGDGSRVAACERFAVRTHPPEPNEEGRDPAAWTPRWKWERDTENLYSAWVEQLFDYPIDEDLTWPDLQTLLRDPDRNLLYDHLSLGEEADIALGPDCADLPYFLRAYFAWKVKLPFAFRRCSRGNNGRPPFCGEPNTTLADRQSGGDVPAFTLFMRDVANGVHSASARTAPDDDGTDVYPVPMTREAITPGTVFADPYGHLLVVAGWIPQGATSYGILVGADAQPDGTIGRRRFWRGSFLFTPETDQVGAGFKAWRPLVYDAEAGTITALTNDELRRTDEHVRWSADQYEGTADDFYDRMEALINPRPLDPQAMQRVLVDALEEAVARRIVSVDNGVEFMEGRRWAPIEMPSGYDVFETTGAWEDYSTPARDMRLLISIDAVRGFADAVERNPERFGLAASEAAETVRALRAALEEDLRGRTFTYRRSDGGDRRLTLLDLVERAERFEVAYHPNDCVEIRWGAAPDSDEMSTCDHRAPPDHRARMLRYRQWFQSRRRPPR